MGKVLLLVDNSNVFIAGRNKFGGNARFNYEKFENICAGDDVIVEKHLSGSMPPSNDPFWDKMERMGYKVHINERVSAGYRSKKEKAVDVVLGVYGGSAIQKIRPDRVVLLTGDRDFIPIAELGDEMKREQGYSFILDVWAFSDVLSSELEQVSDNAFRIEDYKEDLVYFQYEDGSIESFVEREERGLLEKRQSDEDWYAQRQKKRESERIAQEEKTRFWIGAACALGGAAILFIGNKIFKKY